MIKSNMDFLIELLGPDSHNEYRDYLQRLDEVIELLPERERFVTQLRLKGYTYREIGEQIRTPAISAERVRQIFQKAMRMLRYPGRCHILKGIPLEVEVEEPKKLFSEMVSSEIRDALIDDFLELNIRPSNCLKKAGILTIGQLLDTPLSILRTYKNMGRKSVNEIKEALDELNISNQFSWSFY